MEGKMPEYSVLTKRTPKVDAVPKATGQAQPPSLAKTLISPVCSWSITISMSNEQILCQSANIEP